VRVLITGGQGQLATDLARVLVDERVTSLGRDRLEVTDSAALTRTMEELRPDVVINTTAFHNVDHCESEPEQSFLVNTAVPQRMAALCRDSGALLVHVSTDYVFNGRHEQPYAEDDQVDPLSVYAASKVAGEMAVRCTTPNHLILRTTGLYGDAGRTRARGNFVATMLRLGTRGEPLSVVDDQVLTPSSTRTVAQMMAALIHQGVRGTFHVTDSGQCSWYEFAAEIFRLTDMRVDLRRTTQAERPMPARRPADSVLGHQGMQGLGLPEPPNWQESLARYLAGEQR